MAFSICRNAGRDLMLAGKFVKDETGSFWQLVMGAGSIYVTSQGSIFIEVVRKCRSLWLDKVRAHVACDGIDSVMKAWFSQDLQNGLDWVRTAKEARANVDIKGFEVDIDVKQLPKIAVECLENSKLEKQTSTLPLKLWIRTRKRTKCDKDIEKLKKDQERERKVIDLIFDVAPSCTLVTGWGVENLWIGGEVEWETSGEEMMVRAWQGIEKWPFIGLDCEGSGIWYQVCWYGESGLEIAIFGPGFFPAEMMRLLESKNNWIVGKNVHDEISFLLGCKTGWYGLDIGVLTRDLLHSDHVCHGLGKMIESATGQSVHKVKNSNKLSGEEKLKYGYIRSHNWARQLDGPQLLYASFDAVAPHVIIYDYMMTLMCDREPKELESRVTGLGEVLEKTLNKMVDLILNNKKAHEVYEVSPLLRDPETCFAALDLSVKIEENLEGLGGELPEERRVRMMEQIKNNGQERWNTERMHKKVPYYMLHPQLRQVRTKRNTDDRYRVAKKAKLS